MNQIALDGSMHVAGFAAKGFLYRAGGPSQCLNVAKFTTKSCEAPASSKNSVASPRNLGAVVAMVALRAISLGRRTRCRALRLSCDGRHLNSNLAMQDLEADLSVGGLRTSSPGLWFVKPCLALFIPGLAAVHAAHSTQRCLAHRRPHETWRHVIPWSDATSYLLVSQHLESWAS